MGYQGAELLGQFVIGAFVIIFSDQFFNDSIENYILKLNSISRAELNHIIFISIILSLIFVVPLALSLSYVFFIVYANDEILKLSLASIPVIFLHAIGHPLRAYLIKTNKDKVVAMCQGLSAITALLIITALILFGTSYNLFYVYQLLLFGLYFSTYIVALGDYKSYCSQLTFPKIEWNFFRFQMLNVSLNIFTNRLDTFVIGALLDISDAGIYAFLKRLAQVVQEFFGGTFDKVFLALGLTNTVQEKNKVIYSQALLVLPIYTILGLYGCNLIGLLYNDDSWKDLQNVLIVLCCGGVFRALILVERAGKLTSLAYRNLLTVRVIELAIVTISLGLVVISEHTELLIFSCIFLLKNTVAYIFTANDGSRIQINIPYLTKIFIKLSPIIIGCMFIAIISQQLEFWFNPSSIISICLISSSLIFIYLMLVYVMAKVNSR
jgi:O-antigen/teichoic acid export membrane protein